jgi:ribosomal protein L11 methyltransferase
VIDFGCGSGILSLAACALGAKAVYAVDHDEQAILATKQNTALNSGFEFRLQIGMESILPFDLKADVVIANILADPLITLYPQLLKHTRAGGILVLSGLLENDYSRIVACYETDFRLIECQQKEEWLRLTFKQCDLTGD